MPRLRARVERQAPHARDEVALHGGQPATLAVRDLLDAAFRHAGIDDWRPYVQQDERFFRPADVDLLVGDASKARERLGWSPGTGFRELIGMMVDADLENET